MKTYLLGAALGASMILSANASATTRSRSPMESKALFESWKKQHGKNYDSAEEASMRFNIFLDNLDKVLKHNEEHAAGLHG